MISSGRRFSLSFLWAFVLLNAPSLLACAVCNGNPDSPLSKGMAWGVVALLATVLIVLGFIAAFFVFVAKRSALVSEKHEMSAAASNNEKVS
jgi:hypothetical protein